LKPEALLCTDLTTRPEQVLIWFVMDWQMEFTFHKVRGPLGMETQSQWLEWNIACNVLFIHPPKEEDLPLWVDPVTGSSDKPVHTADGTSANS